MALTKTFINNNDILIIKSDSSNLALLCTACKCINGLTVNFINFKEFEKSGKQQELENNGYTVSVHCVNNENKLIVSSPVSTQNLDTVFYEAICRHSTILTWSTIEKETELTK